MKGIFSSNEICFAFKKYIIIYINKTEYYSQEFGRLKSLVKSLIIYKCLLQIFTFNIFGYIFLTKDILVRFLVKWSLKNFSLNNPKRIIKVFAKLVEGSFVGKLNDKCNFLNKHSSHDNDIIYVYWKQLVMTTFQHFVSMSADILSSPNFEFCSTCS